MNYTTNYLHKWDIIGDMRMSLLHVWAVVLHHQGENTYSFCGIKWLHWVFRLHKILGVFLPDDGGRPLKDVEMIYIYVSFMLLCASCWLYSNKKAVSSVVENTGWTWHVALERTPFVFVKTNKCTVTIYELLLFMLYAYMFWSFILIIIKAYVAMLRVQFKKFMWYLLPSSGVVKCHKIVISFLVPMWNEENGCKNLVV